MESDARSVVIAPSRLRDIAIVTSRMYPSRIICLTEETTETLYLLGEGDRVVGVSGYTVRPPEARKKPRVSAFINANFDKIEALRPDLIFAFSDLQADIVAELVRRGYPVFTFNQRSVDEILQMILVVGGIVGRADRAQALVDGTASGLEAIARRGRAVAPAATHLLRRMGRPADLGHSGGSRNSSRLPAARRSSRSFAAPVWPKTASSIQPRSCAAIRRSSSRRGAARR